MYMYIAVNESLYIQIKQRSVSQLQLGWFYDIQTFIFKDSNFGHKEEHYMTLFKTIFGVYILP